jgi:hypothetical protein
MLSYFNNAVVQPIRQWRRLRRKHRMPARYLHLEKAPIQLDAIALWGFLNSEIGLGTVARRYADALRSIAPHAMCYPIPLKGRDSVAFPVDEPRARPGCNIVAINPLHY